MKHIILLALSIFLFAGCGASQETLATQTTDADTTITATPTEFLPTITPTATMEPTPEVPRPAISPNLAPINNALMAFENGTWVTKNTAGKITATYTETGWKYNNDNIAVEIIGWSTYYPFDLTRNKHPECFIKPEVNDTSLDFISNGQPVPDGFLKDTEVFFTGDVSSTNAWFVGRYVGSFPVSDSLVPVQMACIRFDDALVPVRMKNDISDFQTQVNIIKSNDPFQPIGYDGLTYRQIQNTVMSLPIGRQVVVMIPYNYSSNHQLAFLNNALKQVVDALKNSIRADGSKVDILGLPVAWGIPEELIKK